MNGGHVVAKHHFSTYTVPGGSLQMYLSGQIVFILFIFYLFTQFSIPLFFLPVGDCFSSCNHFYWYLPRPLLFFHSHSNIKYIIVYTRAINICPNSFILCCLSFFNNIFLYSLKIIAFLSTTLSFLADLLMLILPLLHTIFVQLLTY